MSIYLGIVSHPIVLFLLLLTIVIIKELSLENPDFQILVSFFFFF